MENACELNKLINELKKEYCALALKAELSTECLNDADLSVLKNLAMANAMDFTIKTAGAEDECGIKRVKTLGAKNIVVPMVESSYALKKFIKLVKKYNSELNILVNIETKTGCENSDEIIQNNIEDIKGIIFGRSDMAYSLGLTCSDVNQELIFNYAKKLSEKAAAIGIAFYIGGNISVNSIDFLKNIPYISGFETRKVIFDSEILNKNPQNAIKKALEFELTWLQMKEQNDFDIERINIIKKRLY